MNIIAIGDVHGRAPALAFVNDLVDEYAADLVAVCGDVSNFGPGSFARDFLNGITAQTLAIPGNCDPAEVHTAIKKSTATALHAGKTTVGTHTFVGYGGAPTSFLGTAFEIDEETMFKELDAVMVPGCILLTHAPPFGHVDRVPHGDHIGSHAIKKIVETYTPLLVVSAHVHEAQGVETVGATTFVNTGPAKNGCAAIIAVDDQNVVDVTLIH